MGRKRSAAKTAEELAADPDHQRHLAELARRMETRRAALEAELAPVLAELHRAGYTGETIRDVLNRHAPLPDDAVRILLHGLGRVEDAAARETLARAVGCARGPYPGSALTECFASTRDESLKFAIANTLVLSRPTGVEDWLVRAVESPIADGTRGMLALALAKHVPAGRALPPLHRILDELPGQVAEAFGAIGGSPERDALRRHRLASKPDWPGTAIRLAIRRIGRRLDGGGGGPGERVRRPRRG